MGTTVGFLVGTFEGSIGFGRIVGFDDGAPFSFLEVVMFKLESINRFLAFTRFFRERLTTIGEDVFERMAIAISRWVHRRIILKKYFIFDLLKNVSQNNAVL